jgi:hypothetical protein
LKIELLDIPPGAAVIKRDPHRAELTEVLIIEVVSKDPSP